MYSGAQPETGLCVVYIGETEIKSKRMPTAKVTNPAEEMQGQWKREKRKGMRADRRAGGRDAPD